jgi:biopolymer transport protein TolR
MRSSARHKRFKLKSEINVVPYIDVMLVLLIIFMVTAPMMNLGVDIQLPQTQAKSLQDKKDPIVISVDENGQIYLSSQGSKREPVSAEEFKAKITAFQKENPDLQVLVAGDERANYGKVYLILPVLQEAGVTKIGLMSQPESSGKHGRP